MNWKNVQGSGCGLILRYYPGICVERLRKTTEDQVRIAGLCAEILTSDLQHMKQGCETLERYVRWKDE
jgi:hypothetical protein